MTTRGPAERRAAERRGHAAEWAAAALLRAKGYRIMQRRYRGPGGEIDLVARRGRTIVFVEVKARPTLDDGAWSVTPEKRRRLVRAAEGWLMQNPELAGLDLRLDVILIAPGRLPRHLQNAFGEGE